MTTRSDNPAFILVPSWMGAGRSAGPESLESLGEGFWPRAVETISTSIGPHLGDYVDDYARRQGLDRVSAIAERLSRRVLAHLRSGRLPIAIGGDHTLTIGGFSGLRMALGPTARIGMVWVDAHADLNTHETTESHNSHGMPLAALAGLGHPALVHAGGIRCAKLGLADVALVGLRSVDAPEKALLDRHPEVLVVEAREISECGLGRTISRLLEWGDAFDAVYLSFDLDAVRSSDAPGVTTPVPEGDGLSHDEAVTLVASLAGVLPVRAADFVEYWSEHDEGGRTAGLIHDLVNTLLEARAAARPLVRPQENERARAPRTR